MRVTRLRLASLGLALTASLPAFAGGTLQLRLKGEPATLDWSVAKTSFETPVLMNLMEGLVRLGDDFKPQPGLATRWETSPDQKRITFTLRDHVTWTDGRSLTAQHFVDSWVRLLSPKTRAAYAQLLDAVEGARDFRTGRLKDASKLGVRAVNEKTLEVRLQTPVPYFLQLLSFWATFPFRLDQPKATLGPYRLKSWTPGKSLVLVRNEAASTPLPPQAPDAVELKVVPNDAEARELFKQGALDVWMEATTQDLVNLGQSVQVAQFPYLATYYLGINTRKGPLKDPRVRKALFSAVDRAQIPGLLRGGQVPALSWVAPGVPGFAPSDLLFATPSLYEGKAHLTQAGYAEGRGLPALNLWLAPFDGADALAKGLEEMFQQKLGVQVRSQKQTTPAAFYSGLQRGEASLFVTHWGGDYGDPDTFFAVFSSEGGANYTGWKSADYSRWVENARTATSPSERLRLYRLAQGQLIETDAVCLPLFYQKKSVLLRSTVKKLRLSPLNYLFFTESEMTQPAATPIPK